MTQNETKPDKTKPNETAPHLVTLIIVLSEAEQVEAAKQKAVQFSTANPDKLTVIGKPSATKDGLRVEFGVMK